jgi:hypothetical protein
MRFRCAFAISDELHEFASNWLRSASIANAGACRSDGRVVSSVLNRSGRFQVEMVCARAGTPIPPHVHPSADTIEVGVSGAVRLWINGADPFEAVPDDRLAAFTRMRGVRINRADVHGGLVLPGGAVFLSIQRWIDEPLSVIDQFVEAA